MYKPAFVKEVEERSGVDILSCYQCGKCSAGCPVANEMGFVPNQVIRMVQRGMRHEVLESQAIWVCVGCETCTSRCPREVDLARVIDTLRTMSLVNKEVKTAPVRDFFSRAKTGLKETFEINREKSTKLVNSAFLETVKRFGRSFEAGLVSGFNINNWLFFSKATLGLPMFLKGKLKMFPQGMKGKEEIKKIFEKIEEMEGKKV